MASGRARVTGTRIAISHRGLLGGRGGEVGDMVGDWEGPGGVRAGHGQGLTVYGRCGDVNTAIGHGVGIQVCVPLGESFPSTPCQ